MEYSLKEDFRDTTYCHLPLFHLIQHSSLFGCRNMHLQCTHKFGLVVNLPFLQRWLLPVNRFCYHSQKSQPHERGINSWHYGIGNGCRCRLYLYNKFETVTNSNWIVVTSQSVPSPEGSSLERVPWDNGSLFAWLIITYFPVHRCWSQGHMHHRKIPILIPTRTVKGSRYKRYWNFGWKTQAIRC